MPSLDIVPPADGVPRHHHLDRRADQIAAEGAGNADDLLTTTDLAEWLGVSTQWLEIGRSKGYGPLFVVIGPRRIRYRRDDVMRWLRQRTHAATAEYGARGGPGRPRKKQAERQALRKRDEAVTP